MAVQRYARIKQGWVRITDYKSQSPLEAEGILLKESLWSENNISISTLRGTGRFQQGVHTICACQYAYLADRLCQAKEGDFVSVRADNILTPAPREGMTFAAAANYKRKPEDKKEDTLINWDVKSSASTAYGSPILIPVKFPDKIDPEPGVVAVIGRGGRDICIEDASNHILGYMVGNYVCSRDADGMDYSQEKERIHRITNGYQLTVRKSFPIFSPVGPFLVTGINPEDLLVILYVNGKEMYSANTGNMLSSIYGLIAHASQFQSLQPGDLIFTGAFSKTGAGRPLEEAMECPQYLRDGDRVMVSVSEISTGETLGTLENRVRSMIK
jgi:2-keto-4-pentenoate hydratase/2-oxohepta-3-ene-1,7-dioic acid hydratase in catechol pathway